ncbi:MAG: tripeptide aminopeptidase, partial [Maribacter sp.]
MIDKQLIIARFIEYVTIDTESDPNNPAFPSTKKQWNLAKILEKELNQIGLQDVELDENC